MSWQGDLLSPEYAGLHDPAEVPDRFGAASFEDRPAGRGSSLRCVLLDRLQPRAVRATSGRTPHSERRQGKKRLHVWGLIETGDLLNPQRARPYGRI